MKFKKLFLMFAFYLSFSSLTSLCNTSSITTQHVSNALNTWFNKKTLTAGAAIMGSALLGIAMYRIVTKWLSNYLSPGAKGNNGTVQAISYTVTQDINQQLNNNWNKKTIEKLRLKYPKYENYLNKMITEGYSREIKMALEGVSMDKRQAWIQEAKNILTSREAADIPELTTKMQALEKINTDPFPIRYDTSKPYQSPKKILLEQ